MTRIAILQMTSGIDPAANAITLSDAVNRAGGGGARMLFTPEMSGLLDRDRKRAAETIVPESEDRSLAAVREAAAKAGIWVALGSLAIERDDGRWANRSLVIDPAGAIAARYDKIHMFDVTLATGESWRESAAYVPGEAVVTLDGTPVGRLGLTVCYDIRFPELFQQIKKAGAEMLFVPAAFPLVRIDAWRSLLIERAKETGLKTIGINAVGDDSTNVFGGNSMVIAPDGTVLHETDQRSELTLDFEL